MNNKPENVATKQFKLGEFITESGEIIRNVEVAYETYGQLNHDKSNAILVTHAFSGDAHAAGWHDGAAKPGWWDNMIGAGKAFDTDKYFIICSNVLGGCAGTTGPSTTNPATGKPYGSNFPRITIGDMVEVQRQLVESFGIKKLLSVAGGSMGGMQVLQWAATFPDKIHSAIAVATALKHSSQQIAFNYVQRQLIKNDSNWNRGNYYNDRSPATGLSSARMLGHVTYTSSLSMHRKFARRRDETEIFEVEKYLRYNGGKFVERFDANSYIYLTEAMDDFDVSQSFASAAADDSSVAANSTVKFLVIAFESDWLYPTWQSQKIVKKLHSKNYTVQYEEVASTYGHDAFLLEIEDQAKIIRDFLVDVTEVS